MLGCGLRLFADKPKPTPLENGPAKIAGRQVWSTRPGSAWCLSNA
jgi:hypothetical protein